MEKKKVVAVKHKCKYSDLVIQSSWVTKGG